MPGVRKSGDGRVLRGRRNREAVVDALLSLVGAGDLKPTAKAIAEEAGISRRSVFQHFADVGSIHKAASERVGATLHPLLTPIDPSGSVEDRLHRLLLLRLELLRTVDPVAKAARVREPFSEQLKLSRRRLSRLMSEQCRAAFATELAELPTAEAETAAAAIAGALSWSLWNHLVTDLGLDDDRATAVMRHLVLGVLGTADLFTSQEARDVAPSL